jgi:PKD repeat protein
MTSLNFANTIEIVDNSFNTVPYTTDNGSITVPAAPPAGVTLFLDNASGMVGSQMNISMKAVDFTAIAAIQGTVQFDPSALTFSSVNYSGLSGMNFGITQAASGKITFSWVDMSGSGTGVDMADSAALFTLQFTHSCTAGTTSIDIVNSPTPVEVDDATFNTLATTLVSGSVTATPLTVNAMASSPTICEGTSTTLTASGASTYAWLPTDSLSSTSGSPVMAHPSATTTYTVTGTALGCNATSSVTVTVNPLPDAGFTYTDDGNGTYTFTSTSQNTTSLLFDFGDGNSSQTMPVTHTYAANGAYYVYLDAINSCGNDSVIINSFVVNTVPAVGIKTVLTVTTIAVYPNPNNGVFHVRYDASADAYTVQVLNALGELVFSKACADTADHLTSLDLSAFENGMYHIQIKDQGQILNSRITIQK